MLICAALSVAAPARAATQTITTTYTYNADGAPTAITTQVDARPPTTAYLTWDNFRPDADTPSTGTVSPADGNLLGLGASPGADTQFTYDVRDRLIGCSAAGESAASYAYDPASMMGSSTLASGDALQFYYDNAANARMINTVQPSTGLTAGFLGPVRYLSDGTEQVLLNPRKDVAGVYDADAQTMRSYSYDPYGAAAGARDSGLGAGETQASPEPQAPSPISYDLTSNPFQYAGEFRDPVCDAYYLRRRWYLAAQQTFLSRDWGDPMHRYGYTGGNPVGRTDPSGLRHTGGRASRDIDKAVHALAPGIAGYIEPVLPVWGQVLGGIELLGDVASFWHHPTWQKQVAFDFLFASIASEAVGETWAFDARFATPSRAFQARIGMDAALGGGQTAVQSVRHGRIDVPALIQGIDTTAFGIFYARLVGGLGYRPYNMTAEQVERFSLKELSQEDADDLLVFRARRGVFEISDRKIPFTNTSPLLESLHLGGYHEQLIGFGRAAILMNELTVDEAGYAMVSTQELDLLAADMHYTYVGRVPASEANVEAMKASPFGVPFRPRSDSMVSIVSIESEDEELREYSLFRRNCQMHSAAVRRGLGLR